MEESGEYGIGGYVVTEIGRATDGATERDGELDVEGEMDWGIDGDLGKAADGVTE